MIGLDTNILVRFLVEDDERQSRQARKLVRQAVKTEDPLFISDLVLAEAYWVLARGYRFSKEDFLSVIRLLINAKQLKFSSSDRVHRATRAYEEGRGDFADYLIREQCQEAGCDSIATFDKRLLREAAFFKP